MREGEARVFKPPWCCLWLIPTLLLGACRGHDPTPRCVRVLADAGAQDGGNVEGGATCPAGWVVKCPATKPKLFCVYDQGETQGLTRCIDDPLDWAFPIVRATCEPSP